jgi:hypothetical protein
MALENTDLYSYVPIVTVWFWNLPIKTKLCLDWYLTEVRVSFSSSMFGSGLIGSRFSWAGGLRDFWLDFHWTYIQVFWNTWLFSCVPTSIFFPVDLWKYHMQCISNKHSFHQEHPGVSDGPEVTDGTSYHLTEKQMKPVTLPTGHVAYLPCSGIHTTCRIQSAK